jgi:hypothetical protein
MKNLFILFLCVVSQISMAKDHYNFWPNIPFNIKGVNLCEFTRAYSQDRVQYMQQMNSLASSLLWMGVYNPVQTLIQYNRLYERNLAYARIGLGTTLSSSFKAYLERYYKTLKPKKRYLRFKYSNTINEQINLSLPVTAQQVSKIDLFAFGSYTLSPNCSGNIIVTLSLLDRDGLSREYMGQGRSDIVMSQIASQVFEDFQRTKFPSEIKIGNKTLTILGGLNGDIETVTDLYDAKTFCQSLGGRLPRQNEYKFINAYGSWSGGVSLERKIWAMDYPSVFVPYFTRRPVRSFSEVNEREYYYVCVK